MSLLAYGSYDRFGSFVQRFPEYADRAGHLLRPLTGQMAKLEESAGKLNPDAGKRVQEVKIKEAPAWPTYLVRGFGSVSNALIIFGVVPFLLFFLLTKKEKWYQTLVQVLGPNNDPQEFSDRLAAMVRRFALGNLLVGLVMSAATAAVLLALKIQGAVIIGALSGFLNLIPFLGVFAATLVPVAAALVQGHTMSTLLIIGVVVIALHIITLNFVLPQLIGSRINIGPVAATAGILFWGWLWGIVGVLLAIPLTGTVKLIADCHPSLRNLSVMLGEDSPSERFVFRRRRPVAASQADTVKVPE